MCWAVSLLIHMRCNFVVFILQKKVHERHGNEIKLTGGAIMNTNPGESTTRALVLSVSEDGWAEVAADRKQGCDGCGEVKSTCHSCLTATRRTVRALNKAGAEAGDLVLLSMESSAVFKYAAFVYFVPVLGLMIGALAGFKLGAGLPLPPDVSTILFGLLGLVAGFMVLRGISKHITAGGYSGPVIRTVIMEGKGPTEKERAV